MLVVVDVVQVVVTEIQKNVGENFFIVWELFLLAVLYFWLHLVKKEVVVQKGLQEEEKEENKKRICFYSILIFL